MKLRFTPRATQDLISIADYVREHSPRGALRVRDAILESLQNLVRFPRLGRPQKVEGVRKLVTRRYPYLVYYTLDEEVGEVVILTIQHPAREREHSDESQVRRGMIPKARQNWHEDDLAEEES